ncbi:MAG: HPr family phosphocarrier protein, partial [Actinobacteria bacterium]|nr:HPr family phosphocarrier protein [Actinomycetota bacterium]
APLSGVLVPIEQVPDPVFAEKMVGEGISIDPVSHVLVAPCDGEVALIHPSQHAVTVRHESGLEVLLHIGLDTVAMRGEGFSPKVELGAKVRTGDPLIVFDLDQVATNAKSLLTQMVISNSEVLGGFEPRSGFVTAGEDAVAEAWVGEAAAEGEAVGRTEISEAVIVPNPTGLHARPASVLAGLAKKFESQIRLQREDVQVNAKSLIAIMSLNVAYGDKVQFVATGDDAEAAVRELTAAVVDGLGEDVEAMPTEEAHVHEPKEAPLTRQRSEDPNVLVGVAASPGLGVGTVYQLRRAEIVVEEEASDRHYERRQLNSALDRAALDLKALESNLLGEAEPDKAAIFTAHRELLEDPDLLDLANSAIDKGKTAAFAWRGAYTTYAARLAK